VHTRSRLASDGKYVYWTEFNESGCKAWQVPVDGEGDAKPVPIPFPNAVVTDASPEGRLLLMVRGSCTNEDIQGIQGAIWELTLASGLTRRVGDLIGREGAYSPDGRQIAFARADEIWVADRITAGGRRVARVPGAVMAVHWSPNGKLLRFDVQAGVDNGRRLWEVSIDGGKARPLALEWVAGSDSVDGAWTAEGRFVFAKKGELGTHLWSIAPTASPSSRSSLEQLTDGPLDFSQPAAIPGRSQLAVVGFQKEGELEHFDSQTQRFVPLLNGISAEMADFSRDGKWVVYVTYPERVLWRSKADGSEAVPLTHGSLHAALPRISPDARLVAFTGDYDGRELRTWIVPMSGGEPRLATQLQPGTTEVAPTWSPDGTKLLFRLDLSVLRHVLAIQDLAVAKSEHVPGSEQKFNQRWSPDGKWIIATPYTQDRIDLFDVRRGEWTRLSDMRADYPNWSHDGEYVYFYTSLDSGEEAIYRVSLKSRKTGRVASLVGYTRAFDDLYSQWVGLAADDSPMILRSTGYQRIYRLSFSGK
jgi:Tol biopolymer transport system component